jgi:predicted RNase H-like HicB family nuclease
MSAIHTAITKQDSGWWVGWVQELPGVNAQERTKQALLLSLKEILREAIDFNRLEAREATGSECSEILLSV